MTERKRIFIESALKYNSNAATVEILWNEIEKKYSGKNRYYHTLNHLDNLLKQLTEIKGQIEDWDTIVFTLFYHDIIYKASKNDNEEKSAETANARLQLLKFPAEKITKCVSQIIATKGHLMSTDNDCNLFTDADLSILGQNWNSYSDYFKQVRKEYSIYPDFIYIPGRKKVINHFLKMESIFKTKIFFDKFENQARENLNEELKML